MNDSKAVVSSGWSSLSTIDEFDMGVNKNKINVITRAEDISKSVAKSLFVESLIDQLCKLLEKDPTKRRRLYLGMCRKLYKMQLIDNTYNIEELAPLRGFYKQALIDALLAPNTRVFTAPPLKYGTSRYATDFEEIGLVGSGGFGKVYKAKNLLDQVTYAVKKIPLKYQNIATFQKKLNEVKALAKLNHANIVQYKAAWLEPYSEIYSLPQSPDETLISSNGSDIVVFQNNQSHSANISNHASPQENESNIVVCKYPSKGTLQRSAAQVSALLYVTMHLCDGTLNEWLRNRNLKDTFVDISNASCIMLKATKGVQYIHSCNIVHHDIKPSNIFLSSDLKSIEVGDFGLSCLQGYDHSGCPLERGQFGTPLYAAPEQLKGVCDSKSDIFSLGLIFIELLTIFKTEMERIKILTEARSGNLPSSIPQPLVPVIKELLSCKPNKRPTAAELIITLQDFYQSELKETTLEHDAVEEIEESSDVAVMKDNSTSKVFQDKDEIIKQKDKEISELRQILAERENEIAYLKHLMTQYSS